MDIGRYSALNNLLTNCSVFYLSNPSDMKMIRLKFTVIVLLCIAMCKAQTLQQIESSRIHLPNGWGITPLGKSLPLGDLPLNIVQSPDKKYLAVTNNGQSTQSVQLIDARNFTMLDTRILGKSWLGLAFGDNSHTLYASGGNDNWIVKFDIKDNRLVVADTFRLGKPWPERISVAGLSVNESAGLLYAVTKENNSLYVFDLKTKSVKKVIPLGGEGYTCLLSPDKKILYASCWGCSKVVVFNCLTEQIDNTITVGENPNDLWLNKAGNTLYVANSNDNSVSVIDLTKNKVVETLNAALYPNAPTGSTTNSITLSEDEKTLYIANADNNCLAVYDVSHPGNSKSIGFIPTGWYPTCVRVSGKNILVANGKGFTSMANPKGPNPLAKKQKVKYQQGDQEKPEEVQYIGSLFKGTLSVIQTPDDELLATCTKVAYANTPYTKEGETQAKGRAGNPIPTKVGASSPIKYVFYIIKENRTYDQVLGDLKGGNGDTSLCLFGEKITPHQHALAQNFVLLDNFYVDGEVSADGHNWSTSAYATDYLEKTWPTSYGGRGGDYDAEGNRDIANSKSGFIWGYCKKYGVTYRTYGEFADDYKPNIPVLKNHFCPFYTSWDQSVMDTTRFGQWRKDFDSLLAINAVPRLNTLRFINDHTEGLRIGHGTPFAEVADNDLATGLFIEYLSKSSIWNESVVFVLEDDAQAGPDHVDAHRSPAYVAGGFVKRNFTDHTSYSTSSILRTMELILGLPPMSQYDAAAEPLWRCFNTTADASGFKAIGAKTDLFEKNTAINEWQRKSEYFDFTKEDRAPEAELNAVIWAGIKGNTDHMPPPKHAAFVLMAENDDK